MNDTNRTAAKQGRNRINLDGTWERWLGGQFFDHVAVPSSYRPIGTAVLKRKMDLPGVDGRRAVLRFEGVAHQGAVRVNGAPVGAMGPWTPYEFDITQAIHAGVNELEVEITDWQVPLGPTNAWEASGGIIRDVLVELRSDPYIENARLQYDLGDDFQSTRSAACTLDVFLRGTRAAKGKVTAELLRGGKVVAAASCDATVAAGESVVRLEWRLRAPSLWSPQRPDLYTLRVRLEGLERLEGADEFVSQTGFRKLEVRGEKFLLNGRELVLCGLAKHDMWKDQGHTVTDEQLVKDMRMMKAMGANIVRLVHYPHDRRTVEAADRLGLFVTEESGLMWLKFPKLPREVLEAGYGNLERTVRRDWNSPSVFAILLANESVPEVAAVREGVQRMKALAPRMLVSSAHFHINIPTNLEETKKVYDEGGLEFYTQHLYTYDMDYFGRVATVMKGKPLVFTEWGGRAVGQVPLIMDAIIAVLGKLVEQGRLAGHVFWSWADLPQFSRVDNEMEGGILKSGVVTEDRVVRPGVRTALKRLFRYRPRPAPPPSREPRLLRIRTAPLSQRSRFQTIPLQSVLDDPSQAQAWAELEALMGRFWETHDMTPHYWEDMGKRLWLWSRPKLKVGSIPFHTAVHEGQTRPIVLTPERRQVEIPVDAAADRLHILGNIVLPRGFPVVGRLGELVGRYVIVYEDGQRQELPLRWGQEVAQGNMIANATRIDPATTGGERAIVYVKNPVREVYQTRILSFDARPEKPGKPGRIDRLVCEMEAHASAEAPTPTPTWEGLNPTQMTALGPEERSLLLFAVTAERK